MPSGVYKRTEKTINKLKEARKKRPSRTLGKHWKLSKKRKREISLFFKGRKKSKIHCENISKGRKGIKFSDKHIQNLSISHSGKVGKRASNWQGGISFEPYSVDWNETLKRAIRERDNYICQLCNQYGNVVHHIDYNKQNCNPDNLITLCRKCNGRVNANRNIWIRIFN